PSRIRYTSVSVPYHIGNGWGGGLVPIVTTSMYLSTGSVGYALLYPIIVPAVMFLIAIFVMPGTRKHSIWEEGAIEAARSRAQRPGRNERGRAPPPRLEGRTSGLALWSMPALVSPANGRSPRPPSEPTKFSTSPC